MSKFKIKYVMLGDELHKIEEYTYRGYGDSTHTGSNISKVPPEMVEEVKAMLRNACEELLSKQESK